MEALLSCQLRQSISPFVRDNIFINPNLIKAEAQAAYELRCGHRETVNRLSVAAALPAVANSELNSTVPTSSLQSSVPNDSVIWLDQQLAPEQNLNVDVDVDAVSSVENDKQAPCILINARCICNKIGELNFIID